MRCRRYRLVAACCCLAIASCAATTAHAAERFWSNINGGTFTDTANWTSGLAAGSLDNANFNLNAPSVYFVEFGAPVTTSGLKISGDQIWFDLVATYTVSGSTNLQTGAGVPGRLTINGGTLAGNTSSLGAAGGVGVGTILSGQWTNAATMDIGNSGQGTLIVLAGARSLANNATIGTNPAGAGTL